MILDKNTKTTNEILRCLCDEFQSIWIVNTSDFSMHAFAADENESIPASIETANSFNSYQTAREWYIQHYVMPHDKKRLLNQTAPENVYNRIADGKPYHIEYSRINVDKRNYNQLFFAKIDLEGDEQITTNPECNGVKHFILGFRDIDVRVRAERDDLTGLYTRQAFFSKAEHLLSQNPELEFDLIITDIVDFKKINETYGVNVGDDILRCMGASLAQIINDDLLVGRYGGDQFVILARKEFLDFLNYEEEFKFLEAEIASKGLPFTEIKLGVFRNVIRDKSIISTCDKAHIALNSIKHSYGKRIAEYNEVLKKEFETNRKIEGSMHSALVEEQFKIYYQPKHDAATGKLVGAEALIRWIHPEYGFMSPADFIPLFEKNGFVVEADNYVWQRTCKNIKRWIDMGIDIVPISVNASRLTFEQPNLLLKLQGAVEQNGIAPEHLHIEITETLMTEDVDALINKLTDIRKNGYKIELDDFGAGYSSINILSSLPLDIIKLDMSFMKQFGDEKRTKVLAASIKLAKELGFKTVSEGVEIKEQRDMLNELGVDAIQGYYYSKPLSEDDFEKYLIDNL